MAFQKLNFNVSPEAFAGHVDIHDPKLIERVEQRNKDMNAKWNQLNQQNKIRATWNKSLWASGEIEFTFDDWKPNERDNVKKARSLGNKAFLLTKEMVNGHLNVVMSGDAGVGKTSLALAMLDKLRLAGKTTLFVSVIALNELVSNQYEYADQKGRLYYLQKAMCKSDILLLDDFGADGGDIGKVMSDRFTGARKDMQSLMYKVANQRYEGTPKERKDAKKDGIKLIKPVHQTIITTNNMTSELERIYGQRTVSRLITRDPNHRLAFNDMEDMRAKEGI